MLQVVELGFEKGFYVLWGFHAAYRLDVASCRLRLRIDICVAMVIVLLVLTLIILSVASGVLCCTDSWMCSRLCSSIWLSLDVCSLQWHRG